MRVLAARHCGRDVGPGAATAACIPAWMPGSLEAAACTGTRGTSLRRRGGEGVRKPVPSAP